MGSPAAAEEGGEEMGGEKCERTPMFFLDAQC